MAYASRALNPAEKNYAITELETLAVVWAVTHFHSYLYGHEVTIYTDHSAVKAVLETPNPTGKHARWWTRIYGLGLKKLNILYRPGRENVDALSRAPVDSTVSVASITSAEDETISTLLDLDRTQPPPFCEFLCGRTEEGPLDRINGVLSRGWSTA